MAIGVNKAPVEWLIDANICLCKFLGKLCAVTLDSRTTSQEAIITQLQHVWCTLITLGFSY